MISTDHPSLPSALKGLTSLQAKEELRRVGPNELPRDRPRSSLRMLLNVVREPMVALLIASAALYFSLGDRREALVLLVSVVMVVSITWIQERKTERALESLKDLSSPRAHVLRDGVLERIPAREVVPGDVLVIEEGDRVPADGLILQSSFLRVDESLLTGESVSVDKSVASEVVQMAPPTGATSPFVYASTLAVGGRAQALVLATGSQTEVGKIGRALQSEPAEDNVLQKQVARLVKTLAVLAASFCVILVVAYGVKHGELRAGLLAGLTMAMSLLPEEFPIVLAVFLALGAYRMSKQRVLTRRLSALENLGAATVLCTDKTGTLTENRMRVVEAAGTATPDHIAAVAALACPIESFDAVDRATVEFGREALSRGRYPRRTDVLREFPLSSQLPILAEARRWEGQVWITAKGSPEAVASRCRWNPETRQVFEAEMARLTTRGLRVLAVADTLLQESELPQSVAEMSFSYVGLIGLEDPLREGVAQAIAECHRAGVTVKMITGDHPTTALAIARQSGLPSVEVLLGTALDEMPGNVLAERIRNVHVFARVSPLSKTKLVEALRASGEVVAMTGDGVNDAPALRGAHIGIAMGGRGTDVAREAADLVVVDDNFVSIVGAIRMGRRIYANLRKSLAYLLSVHIPIAGVAMLPIFLDWPLLFTPVHVLFLELIIDPASSVAFEMEVEERDEMRHPPRRRDAPLLERSQILLSLVEGLCVFLAVAVAFLFGRQKHAGDVDARTLAFTLLILSNLALILVNRSRSRGLWETLRTPNRAWWWVVLGTGLALAAVLYVPFLRSIFRFSPLHADDWLFCAIATSVVLAVLVLLHAVVRRHTYGRLSGAAGKRTASMT
ncbi:MAG: cation-translocating P-type ATPase [Myxococcaceae bacterium]